MEFIDDHPVVSHRIRFKNRIDIDEDQARHVKDDRTIVWLVRARCLPPQYHPITADSDERYRINVQAVTEALPLDGEALAQAVAYLDHGGTQGTFNLDVPVFPEPDGQQVVPFRADIPLALEVGEVEVVGSIYPDGHRPASRALIEEAFGRP